MTSRRLPARPSRAGSKVIEAMTVKTTAMAEPMPMPRMKPSPMTNMSRTEMTTVMPAKSTARPAVSRAWPAAASGSIPLWRSSR